MLGDSRGLKACGAGDSRPRKQGRALAPRACRPVGLPTTTLRAYRGPMLKVGDPAPDFPIGETTLVRILKDREVVVFFFPKAFTPG